MIAEVTGEGMMTPTQGGRMLMGSGGGDLLPRPEMTGVTGAATMVVTVMTETGEIVTTAVTATTGTEGTGAAEASPITSLPETGEVTETAEGTGASPEETETGATAGEETGKRGERRLRSGLGSSWLLEVNLLRTRRKKLEAPVSLEALSL